MAQRTVWCAPGPWRMVPFPLLPNLAAPAAALVDALLRGRPFSCSHLFACLSVSLSVRLSFYPFSIIWHYLFFGRLFKQYVSDHPMCMSILSRRCSSSSPCGILYIYIYIYIMRHNIYKMCIFLYFASAALLLHAPLYIYIYIYIYI